MKTLVTQVMMSKVFTYKLVMNPIMPLLLRLTEYMVVAWKQGLSSKYTKFAKSKEERNSVAVLCCTSVFNLVFFKFKYFS